jgi:hypothetical protein
MSKQKSTINTGLTREMLNRSSYYVSEVSDRIVKVAFDIVRFKDDDNDAHLWEVQSSDDGDYIVALYDVSEDAQKKQSSHMSSMSKKASANEWSITVNDGTIDAYKSGVFIFRIASTVLGIPTEEAYLTKSYLPKKLASDPNFVQAIVKTFPASQQVKIASKLSELA